MSENKELVLKVQKVSKKNIYLQCPFCNSVFSVSIEQLRKIMDKEI